MMANEKVLKIMRRRRQVAKLSEFLAAIRAAFKEAVRHMADDEIVLTPFGKASPYEIRLRVRNHVMVGPTMVDLMKKEVPVQSTGRLVDEDLEIWYENLDEIYEAVVRWCIHRGEIQRRTFESSFAKYPFSVN
jgi:hypothetical protein